MVDLKLKVEAGAAALASAIWIDPEEDLTELHRLRILDGDLTDHARDLGLDLIHDLHRFDDADGLPRRYPIANLDVGLGSGLRRHVERAYHGRPDLLEVCGRRGRPGSGLTLRLIR